jgi:P-type conjugative transfer protein TrbJ
MKSLAYAVAVVIVTLVGHAQIAHAQLAVIDPANLVENVRSSLYELQAVENQITQLQNEARMLDNEGRHLTRLDYNSLTRLRVTLATTTRLLQEADGLAYSVTGTDAGIAELYPALYAAADSLSQMANAARTRRAYTRAATQTALRVQAQSTENMADDTATLTELIDHSQAAVGQLQATQATNQLLALNARLSMQAQQLRIANDRAAAVEQARLTAMAAQTAEMQRRFLGDGTRYTPAAIDFYSR